MKKWLIRILLFVLALVILAAAYAYYQMRSRGFWRLPSYETEPPAIPQLDGKPSVLVFSKTGAFIHKEAIPAAEAMFRKLADEHGWALFITENGAVYNPRDLAKFDVVVWNNSTGDLLNTEQQQALKDYLTNGGGWVGIHGAGDSSSTWAWQNDVLIGAHFIGHPMDPQFQEARVVIEAPDDPVMQHLGTEWSRTDEWYSYAESPRKKGKTILATLDESTYSPKFFGKDIRMGADHPIVWKQCIGSGRALYSAMGHTAESYSEPRFVEMMEQAVLWAADKEHGGCPIN